jgi:SAM-dependent methyltransferase
MGTTKDKAKTAKGSAKGKGKAEDKFANDLQQVRGQYLDYPYPQRNPEDDKVRIMRMQGDFLEEISHNIYKGKQDFKKDFRVLVAGGGTGDSTIWLAKQLMEYPGAEVVYLDFSKASMAIAKKRAEYQGITNITWVEDSILNIPNLNLGKFNFINCTGVLHHLKEPDLGIKILADSLKDHGGMSIMVYALYGRTGVYQIQEIMRMVNSGVDNRQDEVKNGWNIVNNLPPTNWYIRGEELLADHKYHGDIGLYDMFLHKQDRAYSIPQLYEFVEKAGMNIATFVDPYYRACLNIDSYLPENETKAKIRQMDLKAQQTICELMCGNIIKHSVHITKQKDTIADFTDLDNVPVVFNAPDLCTNILNLIDTRTSEVMNKAVGYSVTDGLQRTMNINLIITPHTRAFFRHASSGEMSLREIFNTIREESGSTASNDQLLAETVPNLKSLNMIGILFLRHNSVAKYKDIR